MNAALAPIDDRDSRRGRRQRRTSPSWCSNESSTSASFSRTQIAVGRGASVTIVEYFEGGANALVVPVSEYRIEDNASLQLITYQRLDASAWHVARTTGTSRATRVFTRPSSASVRTTTARATTPRLLGAGAANELRTTFLGSGDQVHDFRTRQFHVAPRTTSTLLSKGAVAGSSRSVYTGLIEIEKGAKRTDARQTNHNLLLSKNAHADSVPNLDIRENDVMCAHASSVGPLDELQRWYLESRGVTPRRRAAPARSKVSSTRCSRRCPSELAELVERDVASVLSSVAEVCRVTSFDIGALDDFELGVPRQLHVGDASWWRCASTTRSTCSMIAAATKSSASLMAKSTSRAPRSSARVTARCFV